MKVLSILSKDLYGSNETWRGGKKSFPYTPKLE